MPETIPKKIQKFQIINNNESLQLSFQVKEPIYDYNFIYNEEENIITVNLHYSTEYFAEIDNTIKVEQPKVDEAYRLKYRNYLYKTGLALTILGFSDSHILLNSTSKVGVGIIILTSLYDIIFRGSN